MTGSFLRHPAGSAAGTRRACAVMNSGKSAWMIFCEINHPGLCYSPFVQQKIQKKPEKAVREIDKKGGMCYDYTKWNYVKVLANILFTLDSK